MKKEASGLIQTMEKQKKIKEMFQNENILHCQTCQIVIVSNKNEKRIDG